MSTFELVFPVPFAFISRVEERTSISQIPVEGLMAMAVLRIWDWIGGIIGGPSNLVLLDAVRTRAFPAAPSFCLLSSCFSYWGIDMDD